MFATPLFFLLSGLCIHLPNIKYLKDGKPLPFTAYLKRRFLRIYPPYLFAFAISISVNYLLVKSYAVNTGDLLFHLFLIQGFSNKYFNSINLVLWTISVEFALYLLYPLFYYLRLKTSLTKALGIVFIVSTVSIATIQYFSLNTTVALFFVFNLWFSWCCGAFIAENMATAPNKLKQPVHLLLYGAVVAAYFLLRPFPIAQYPFVILIWAGPLVLLLHLEDRLSQNKSAIVKLLTALGLSSYSLYLLHQPLIALKNFLAHLLPPAFQMAGLIIGIFVIPIITWLSYLFIEKRFMRKKTAALR